MNTRRAVLSISEIVDAAVLLVAEGGIDAVAIRSVVAGAGASPMALYRHVANKEELVDLAVDRILGSVPLPGLPRASDRDDWLVAFTVEVWRVLTAHPGTADRLLVMGPTGPSGFALMDRICAALALAGRDPEAVASDYLWLMVTVAAFAIRHSSVQRLAESLGVEPADLRSAFVDRVAPHATRLPHLAAVAPRFGSDGEQSFRTAITRVVHSLGGL